MSKPPSEKTIIASLRRELRYLKAQLSIADATGAAYRTRATKAEQDAAEWKRRFDILLSREQA